MSRVSLLTGLAVSVAALAALAAAAGTAAADPLPAHADRTVDYEIDVRLDPILKRLSGRERLVWRNPSTEPVPDLWFHLYLNAFSNSRSTFMRESGGRLRNDEMTDRSWAWIDVISMRLPDGTDLRPSATFEAPDDGNTEDRTVMRVVLPEAVGPGETVTLDIEFRAQLGEVFARTGYRRDFYLVGQWFPKIAVYEPAGMRGRATGGWNCHQFHATSEFYANFGRYRVSMTVPESFVLGATGRRVARRANGDGTVTYTHEQADVHDFAWTADPAFLEVRDRFSASADVTPQEYRQTAEFLGRSLDEVRLSDVEIVLLIHRPRLPQAARHIVAAKQALKYFGLWYGRYPYPTLTIVDPAFGGGGAGGMEYPTFITAGTSALLNRWPLKGVNAVEHVTIHEFGHQFWYGLVASNEFEESWLDEGFNSYSTGKIADLVYGPDTSVASIPGLRLGTVELARLQNGPDRTTDPILTPAWKFESSTAYAFSSYAKTELVLRTLEGYLGERTMARVMRTYHERWRFRHPASRDFFALASEVSGRDLTWFFDQTVLGTGVLDYAVDSVRSVQIQEPAGTFEGKGAGGRRTISAEEAQRRGMEKPDRPYETTVVVERRGDIEFPVEIALHFENGKTERRQWDGRGRWTKIAVTRPERLLYANIDPDRKIVLDVDWLNNSRRVEGDGRAAAKWSSRVLFWAQNLFAALAGF